MISGILCVLSTFFLNISILLEAISYGTTNLPDPLGKGILTAFPVPLVVPTS